MTPPEARDLLLSRTFAPADLDHLTGELLAVDGCTKLYSGGTLPPARRWEYALALHAVFRWEQAQPPPFQGIARGYDVCLGGPPETHAFAATLAAWTDAETASLIAAPSGVPLRAGLALAEVVTCLSVLDRVGDLDRTLYYLSCLVAPGGLLVLTVPYWNRCGPDTAIDNDQRLRIFCPRTYQQLRASCTALHLTTFGGVDPAYHGAQIHDYSLASLVVEKRR
jgi:hypothetical protein